VSGDYITGNMPKEAQNKANKKLPHFQPLAKFRKFSQFFRNFISLFHAEFTFNYFSTYLSKFFRLAAVSRGLQKNFLFILFHVCVCFQKYFSLFTSGKRSECDFEGK
jgi:hypothetical protein